MAIKNLPDNPGFVEKLLNCQGADLIEGFSPAYHRKLAGLPVSSRRGVASGLDNHCKLFFLNGFFQILANTPTPPDKMKKIGWGWNRLF